MTKDTVENIIAAIFWVVVVGLVGHYFGTTMQIAALTGVLVNYHLANT